MKQSVDMMPNRVKIPDYNLLQSLVIAKCSLENKS